MFHKYPYTDFHELNLDGLIAEWKKFLNEYDDIRAKVTDLESAFNSLKEFVDNYFDNLDVQEEINNKLDEMKEDGSLEVLLQSVIDTAQTITLSPVLSVSMYRGIVDIGDDNRPSFLQSACANNDTIYMFFANPVNLGTCICKVFNTAGDPIRSVTVNGLYHANGADFYDGYIYVATIDSLEIVKLDPSDLSIVSRYAFDRGFRSITFDNDGTCYAASGGVLYTVDLENLTYTPHCSIDYINASGYQSGCVRDGWLYEAGVNPSCIYRVNATSGQTSKIYAIDRFVDIYPVGEMETVFNDRVTGKFYAASCAYYNFSNYRQGQIFEISFSTNLAPKRIYSGGSVLSAGALYVGANSNGLPDGSQTNPFPNLAAALSAYVSPACEQYKTFQIILEKDCTDEIYYVRRGNYSLSGNGHKIGQIYAVRSDIEITDVVCQFNNAGYANLPYPAYFNSCKVDIDGLTIIDPAGASYTYAAVFSECDGEAFDWDLSGTVKDINMYRSDVLTNPGIRDRIWYEATNQPNMFIGTETAAEMTAAQLANSLLCANVEIRCTRAGRYVDASFLPGITMSCPVYIYTGSALEVHVIRQNYTENVGYTYEVIDSQDLTNNTTATACTLSSQVRFIGRYN